VSIYAKKSDGDRSRHRPSSIAVSLLLLLGVSLALAPGAEAQHDPRIEPAPAYVIRGATVHTISNGVIESAIVLVRDGKIAGVGADVAVPAGAAVIEGSGLHVYPGLLDAYSRLGLSEVGSVSATSDVNDLGNWNPHLDAYSAVYPASEHIPVARANGVTHALTAPGSGGGFRGGGAAGIPGRAALIHLDGYTVEEMAIEPSTGMIIQWPTIRTMTFDFATFSRRERPFSEAKKEYDEQIAQMEDWFGAAQHYKQAMENGDPTKFERDVQLEHLAHTLGGGLPVIVVANDKRSIESAIEFSERYDLHLILAGGRDSREVKGVLAEKQIPVILGPSQALPAQEDDPYYYPFSLAGELYDAGVKIAFGTFNSSDSRTLPYEAANTVPFGLPHEEALKAITINSAEILGVADRLGSVEPGKLANLIVTDGDPLEIQTHIRYVFIDGIPVDLENRHRRLWQHYDSRPSPTDDTTVTATAETNGGEQ